MFEFGSWLQGEENLFYVGKNHRDSKEDVDSSDSEESEYSGLGSEPESTSEDEDNEQESVSFQIPDYQELRYCCTAV